MKKYIFTAICIFALFNCAKLEPDTTDKEHEVPNTEIQEFRKELEEMRATIESLISSKESEAGISKAEFEALKADNEELKEKVASLTSGFFEVDGLRFDLNGTLISVEKIEKEVVEGNSTNGSIKLTTIRTYDAEGRVIEIMRKYSGYSSTSSIPYYWRQELYEYNGKNCRTITRTNKYGLPAGTQYEEVITDKTFW